MKKHIAWLLLFCLVFSLAACGKPDASTDGSATDSTEVVDYSKQTVVVNTEGMTDLQKAIVITAESYYLRGNYAQYDMGSLFSGSKGKIERRITGVNAPEDYTRQHTGYIDCSGFVCDVYKITLGMRISSGSPWTKTLSTSSYAVLKETPVSSGFDKMTDEELAAKAKTFTETLEPGDIIVYRYAGKDAGHAMLYVGNGMMIHSSGNSYGTANNKEIFEENGTFLYDPIAETLLKEGDRRYLFDKSVYVILRPLAAFKDEIPEATTARMEVMRGIMAEKLCSHTYGQNVAPGQEITFTFFFKNHSNMTKTLTVTDTVPEYTTYVSGAQKVEGNTLTWSVSVPAGESAEVSYTVKVNTDAPVGKTVRSSSNVCGINVNCPEVAIGNTLTQEQQAAVATAFTQLKGSKDGIALVNAIYEQACGKTVFAEQTVAAIWEKIVLVSASDNIINPKYAYASILAPNLYGGKQMAEPNMGAPSVRMRTRMVKEELLIPGDVVMTAEKLYLYTTEGLWDLQTKEKAADNRLETLLTEPKFVVVRPSLGF